jgi:hypothetical protein
VEQLPGTGQAFLDAAVAHANEKLQGTLGANVLIAPGHGGVAWRGLRAGDHRTALRLDRDQHVDRIRLHHPHRDLGRLPR